MGRPADEVVRLSPLRRITIEHLERAHGTGVPVTVFTEARAEGLLAAKAEWNKQARVTFGALLARVLAMTLADHPYMTATLVEEGLRFRRSVDLGVAVALPTGELTVPVVHGADGLSMLELAERIGDVTARARAGKLRMDDVRGASFTLSNVGPALPGVGGTPVIPAGQTGILLVSAPRLCPVVEEGEVRPGSVMTLSLAFDHRVVNGVPALDFLRALVQHIESPGPWLELRASATERT